MDSNNPQVNNSSYFLDQQANTSINANGGKIKRVWDGFQFYARKVWPYLYQLITFLVYEIIRVLKAIVKIGLQQVGMFKD